MSRPSGRNSLTADRPIAIRALALDGLLPSSAPEAAGDREGLISLSNGSARRLVHLTRFAGLPWDLRLSVELFGAYKPDPRVHPGVVNLLQAPAEAVLMVAAHVDDLRAARANGLRTAFVHRPREWGPHGPIEQPEPGEFDLVVDDLGELATHFGS